jgi:signal transduction histidine kinase
MLSHPPAAEGLADSPVLPRDPVEDVIYAVSHDLRGPLLNFQGFLRRLRHSWDTMDTMDAWAGESSARTNERERVATSFRVLEDNARRMDQLLQALLDLSRAGRQPVVRQVVSAAAVVRRVAEQAQPVLDAKKVVLGIGALPDVWAEPVRVEQIFRLALDNALKFLAPTRPGRLSISGSRQETEDVCWIEDNGIGLRPADLERIFLPFGRVREIDTSGHGVGLATIRKLMTQLGGRVWMESTHRQGATLFLAFPVGRASGPAS